MAHNFLILIFLSLITVNCGGYSKFTNERKNIKSDRPQEKTEVKTDRTTFTDQNKLFSLTTSNDINIIETTLNGNQAYTIPDKIALKNENGESSALDFFFLVESCTNFSNFLPKVNSNSKKYFLESKVTKAGTSIVAEFSLDTTGKCLHLDFYTNNNLGPSFDYSVDSEASNFVRLIIESVNF